MKLCLRPDFLLGFHMDYILVVFRGRGSEKPRLPILVQALQVPWCQGITPPGDHSLKLNCLNSLSQSLDPLSRQRVCVSFSPHSGLLTSAVEGSGRRGEEKDRRRKEGEKE